MNLTTQFLQEKCLLSRVHSIPLREKTEEYRENTRIPICPWRGSFRGNAINCAEEGRFRCSTSQSDETLYFRFSDRVTTFIKSALDRIKKCTLSGTC
ncbi:hypothetical protein CDAR_107961 [Caerostris darwini]|uniref:Uncharacterized protein n=1 Tax=Caerostris darwini TaxID=1538125 RepID=A0AAV4X132_9ARAC|nr:hypothetical protein CDAR_107961 [Caerostris darwini]